MKKRYRIGRIPHFGPSGYLLREGDFVDIPASQAPAPGWTFVGDVDENGNLIGAEDKKHYVPEAKGAESAEGAEGAEGAEETLQVGGVVLKKGGRAADRKI